MLPAELQGEQDGVWNRMTIPGFITKELFERAFRNHFKNNNLCILDHKSVPALSTGDNFTSDIFRSTVTYSTPENGRANTITVFVKCSPEARDGILSTIREMKFFEKEIEMYSKILPGLHKILGKSVTLSAQCLYAELSPVPLIIIEDLVPLGFQMQDKRKGLDLEHSLLVIKKVAQLHAASLVMHTLDPNVFYNYQDAMFSGHPFVVNWVNVGIENFIKICKEKEDMKKYIEKLVGIKNNIMERCHDCARYKSGSFAILNHGDCWINNMMFLYDSHEKLYDLRLIDYQLGVFSTPAVDLQYFFVSSPTLEVRRNHLHTILNSYYNELVSTLVKINHPIDQVPTIEEFKKDFFSLTCYGFATAVTTMPMTKADNRNDATLEELLRPGVHDENSFRHHVYTNPNVWEYIKHILKFFEDVGLFDY